MRGGAPEVGILIAGRVVYSCKMKRLAPLHAGAAAPAMPICALVAGPCGLEGRAIFRAIGNDVGLGGMDVRSKQFHIGIAVQCVFLHGLESFDEAGAAIGIDEMIAAMNGKRHRIGFLCCCDAEGDDKHDGVAIRNDRDFHRFFSVVAVRHIDVIGERRAGQACANGADIDDLMRDAKPFAQAWAKSSSFLWRWP